MKDVVLGYPSSYFLKTEEMEIAKYRRLVPDGVQLIVGCLNAESSLLVSFLIRRTGYAPS